MTRAELMTFADNASARVHFGEDEVTVDLFAAECAPEEGGLCSQMVRLLSVWKAVIGLYLTRFYLLNAKVLRPLHDE